MWSLIPMLFGLATSIAGAAGKNAGEAAHPRRTAKAFDIPDASPDFSLPQSAAPAAPMPPPAIPQPQQAAPAADPSEDAMREFLLSGSRNWWGGR